MPPQPPISKEDRIYVSHINIRQSIFFLVLKLIFLDIITAVVVIFYLNAVPNIPLPETFTASFHLFDLSFISLLILIKIAIAIYVVMAWINEYYEIWPTLLRHKRGFIFKNDERYPLAHIRSVKLEQGIFGRFFGFGTITIFDWYLEKHKSLYLIHNPVKYFNIIERLIPRTEREREYFQETEEIGLM